MKLYYLYEIYINNPESSVHACYYYGKHEVDSAAIDNYYGSGKIIKAYKRKHGTFGLTKKILAYYNSSDELCLAEKLLVEAKISKLGSRCLNIAEGGTGSWKHVNENASEEQRHSNAVAGGAGNKKRLEDPVALEQWRAYIKALHASRTGEAEVAIYKKVSSSLKEYYKSEDWLAVRDAKLAKNIETNKKVASKWRAEFYNLFNHTPEYFRKFNKQQEALNLFKRIKNYDKETINYEINRFMEQFDQ